jgi:serine/threonine protein kinase
MSPSGAPFRRSYAMHGAIAAGGMATVHVGRLLGPSGFVRRVAIKRLHPQLSTNEEMASMFAAEARLTARVVHANVVSVLDVVSADGELLLVMEYVHGESFSRLLAHARKTGEAVPVPIVAAVLADVLHGLHAAHEALGEDGAPMHIVHRDVSPQNMLVGSDGVARVVDFGIAKAMGQSTVTRDGPLRGKIPYMPPEQLLRRAMDRRVDVYAAGVVLWEALAGRRLFDASDDVTLFDKVLEEVVPPPSRFRPEISEALDAIAMRAIERDPDRRFPDARSMALAIEDAAPAASSSAVADWVKTRAAKSLAERQAKIDAMERDARDDSGEPAVPAVRAPFASVFLQDESAASEIAGTSAPVIATSAESPALHDEGRTARDSARRKALVAGALGAIAIAGLGASWAASRRPAQTPAAPASSSAGSVATTEGAPPDVAPSATPAGAPPPVSAPVVATPPKPPSSIAKGAPSARWCKVFDPDKGIFVMRSMKVNRCP